MTKPVYLLTVQEAHNCAGGSQTYSLTDLIWAKYEQLDSGEFGTVGNPAFNAEACEFANLLAWVSQLCQNTEPSNTQATLQAHILQALKMLFRSKFCTGRQSWLGYG